ncbi:MAG: hypothetical protein R8G66_33055 [Cytophagales bacterium]|nr:hypothetical protein [Cytophagales bacterium]
MKISLSEIWNFIQMIDQEESGWYYSLTAGNVRIVGLDHTTLLNLRNDENYDTELLPSLFTFREILWQPDVFTEASMSLPGLRILKAYSEECAEQLQEEKSTISEIYAKLILGLSAASEEAIQQLESGNVPVTKVLRDLRKACFPIIKFFIFHPQNRVDYHSDAVNRLNYAVKVMLTQFYGRYTELEDPYWEISYDKGGENGTAKKMQKAAATPEVSTKED